MVSLISLLVANQYIFFKDGFPRVLFTIISAYTVLLYIPTAISICRDVAKFGIENDDTLQDSTVLMAKYRVLEIMFDILMFVYGVGMAGWNLKLAPLSLLSAFDLVIALTMLAKNIYFMRQNNWSWEDIFKKYPAYPFISVVVRKLWFLSFLVEGYYGISPAILTEFVVPILRISCRFLDKHDKTLLCFRTLLGFVVYSVVIYINMGDELCRKGLLTDYLILVIVFQGVTMAIFIFTGRSVFVTMLIYKMYDFLFDTVLIIHLMYFRCSGIYDIILVFYASINIYLNFFDPIFPLLFYLSYMCIIMDKNYL